MHQKRSNKIWHDDDKHTLMIGVVSQVCEGKLSENGIVEMFNCLINNTPLSDTVRKRQYPPGNHHASHF